MSTIEYNAVLFTPFHSITGQLSGRDQRLSDMLNDPRETAIHLYDARVSRHLDPGKILAQHQTAVIPKSEIVIAFEPGPREPAPTKRLYSFVRKQHQEVFMVLDGFEVSGVMHSQGKVDLINIHELLTIQNLQFLPVTQARVTFASDDRYLVKQDAIIVNIRRIHYIAQTQV